MRALGGACAFALLAGCQAEPASDPVATPTRDAEATQAPTVSPELEAEIAAREEVQAGACAEGEEPIFACKVENGKALRVCALPGGAVEYRYGGQAPELALSGGQWASTMYSGGGEAQIRFRSENTDYIVFSRMVRTNFKAGEPNYPAMSDGVIVLREGRFADMQLCDDPDVLSVQYFAAERVFDQADDLFTDETIRADPDV